LRYHGYDRSGNEILVIIERKRPHRLNIENILSVIARANAKIGIVLKGPTDHAGQRILGGLRQVCVTFPCPWPGTIQNNTAILMAVGFMFSWPTVLLQTTETQISRYQSPQKETRAYRSLQGRPFELRAIAAVSLLLGHLTPPSKLSRVSTVSTKPAPDLKADALPPLASAGQSSPNGHKQKFSNLRIAGQGAPIRL
jgi:hypothetical protein